MGSLEVDRGAVTRKLFRPSRLDLWTGIEFSGLYQRTGKDSGQSINDYMYSNTTRNISNGWFNSVNSSP